MFFVKVGVVILQILPPQFLNSNIMPLIATNIENRFDSLPILDQILIQSLSFLNGNGSISNSLNINSLRYDNYHLGHNVKYWFDDTIYNKKGSRYYEHFANFITESYSDNVLRERAESAKLRLQKFYDNFEDVVVKFKRNGSLTLNCICGAIFKIFLRDECTYQFYLSTPSSCYEPYIVPGYFGGPHLARDKFYIDEEPCINSKLAEYHGSKLEDFESISPLDFINYILFNIKFNNHVRKEHVLPEKIESPTRRRINPGRGIEIRSEGSQIARGVRLHRDRKINF